MDPALPPPPSAGQCGVCLTAIVLQDPHEANENILCAMCLTVFHLRCVAQPLPGLPFQCAKCTLANEILLAQLLLALDSPTDDEEYGESANDNAVAMPDESDTAADEEGDMDEVVLMAPRDVQQGPEEVVSDPDAMTDDTDTELDPPASPANPGDEFRGPASHAAGQQ